MVILHAGANVQFLRLHSSQTMKSLPTPNLSLLRRNLWQTRFYYLLWFGGSGSATPFLNLFYLKLGLSGTEIGWIASMSAIVTLAAAPFWANRSESWKRPRQVLQWLIIFNALAFFLLTQQVMFLGIAVVSVIRAFVGAGISPLSDAMALTVTRGVHAGFGSVRVFGSLGYMIFVLISGWIGEHIGLKFSLVSAAILTLMSAVVLLQITTPNFSHGDREGLESPQLSSVLRRLAAQPLMIGVAAMITIDGLLNTGVWQFQAAYMNQLGAEQSIIGLAEMLGALVELPCMIWADHLMKRRSPFRLLTIAMLLFAAFRAFVFLFPSVPTILLAHAAAGMGFSFYIVALVRFIGEQTMPSEARVVLAFFTVTLTNFTWMISTPIAGSFFDHLGPRSLYAIATVGYLLGWFALQSAAYFSNRASTTVP